MTTMENLPEVVSQEQWLVARKALLVKEKEVTHAQARVNADRRRLPMVRIDKPYRFEGTNGTPAQPDEIRIEGHEAVGRVYHLRALSSDEEPSQKPRFR